ncbi:hypothetical protein Q8A67_021493 [Cirrhinus molitorella]|uniref:Uncharacterized protein n=1 Tax=Cirrhinus molitorella TaxID=172907 RepID=A0AA88PAU4_9TELE|nr:hypothetical protein Q8A67_021493 [Cirrhinus molitorella]
MCKLHPAVAACVKLCCHDDTPARLAQGRSGGDDELDVPGDGVCAICTHTRKEALCSAFDSSPELVSNQHLTKQCSGSVRIVTDLSLSAQSGTISSGESTPLTPEQNGAVLSGHAASMAEKASGGQ